MLMSSDPISREQLADLLMAVQGFRPPATALLELCSTGHLWETLSKPRRFDLSENGKDDVVRFLSIGLVVKSDELLQAAGSLKPSAPESTSGAVFLDTYESAIRAGEDPVATLEQAIFVAWLVSRLDSQPQSGESRKVCDHIDRAVRLVRPSEPMQRRSFKARDDHIGSSTTALSRTVFLPQHHDRKH